MDIVLHYADDHFFTPYVYPEWWKPDDSLRQLINLYVITNIGGALLYLSCATASYYLLFDHQLMKHPLFLKVKLTFFNWTFNNNNFKLFSPTESGKIRDSIYVMVRPVD